MAQILINSTNSIFWLFSANLIFMGILLSTCAGYMTIKMYGQVHFILYLCGPSISISISAGAIVILYLFGLPFKNLKSFKEIWLNKVHKRENKKVLASLKSCGFQMGPYGVSTSKLGLLICDDIIHNIVTALLLAT